MSFVARCPADPAFDHDFAQEPHLRQALLREEAPAQRMISASGLPGWVITRYAEARTALADPRFSKDVGILREVIAEQVLPGAHPLGFSSDMATHMLNSDPPEHTLLRKLVAKAFTTRQVERLRPRVEAITDELLDAMAGQSEVDLLDPFAFPLPITVICELLGVDESRRGDFREWSNGILESSSPELTRANAVEMETCLRELLTAKREDPGGDLLTALIEVGDGEDRLSERELVAMSFLLLIAGHETAVDLIANTVLALLSDPPSWRRCGQIRAWSRGRWRRGCGSTGR